MAGGRGWPAAADGRQPRMAGSGASLAGGSPAVTGLQSAADGR